MINWLFFSYSATPLSEARNPPPQWLSRYISELVSVKVRGIQYFEELRLSLVYLYGLVFAKMNQVR